MSTISHNTNNNDRYPIPNHPTVVHLRKERIDEVYQMPRRTVNNQPTATNPRGREAKVSLSVPSSSYQNSIKSCLIDHYVVSKFQLHIHHHNHLKNQLHSVYFSTVQKSPFKGERLRDLYSE
jgi:hypothetical protein